MIEPIRFACDDVATYLIGWYSGLQKRKAICACAAFEKPGKDRFSRAERSKLHMRARMRVQNYINVELLLFFHRSDSIGYSSNCIVSSSCECIVSCQCQAAAPLGSMRPAPGHRDDQARWPMDPWRAPGELVAVPKTNGECRVVACGKRSVCGAGGAVWNSGICKGYLSGALHANKSV